MFHKTSEIFEFNKMMFIYLAAILTFFLLSFRRVLNGKHIMVKTPYLAALGLLILVLGVSTLVSIDQHTSLFGYYGRFNGGLISIIAYGVLFLGLVSAFLGDHKGIHRLLVVSLASSLIVILWGLPGRIGLDLTCYLFTGAIGNECWSSQFQPQERLFSTLGQPNWLGAYLAVNFFIGLYFFARFTLKVDKTEPVHPKGGFNIDRFVSIALGGYVLLNFMTILFTRSRSTLLAIGVSLVAFFLGYYMLFRRYRQDERKAILRKLSFLFVGMFALILIFKTGIAQIDKLITFGSSQQAEVSSPKPVTTSDITESGDIRKIVWEGAWRLGFLYPTFGTGPETFAYSYYRVRPIAHNMTSEWDFLYNKAHNEYLNYLATTGFVGLGSYLMLIFVALYTFSSNIKHQISKLQNKNHNEGTVVNKTLLLLSLLCAYATVLITNFFGFSTSTVNLFFYLIPGLLIAHQFSKEVNARGDPTEVKAMRLSIVQYVKIGFLSLLSLYLLYYVVQYYRADVIYAQAESATNHDDYQRAAKLYSEALKLHEEHVYQDKLSYALANLAFLHSFEDKDASERLKEASVVYNKLSQEASPYNPIYWKTKAKNHFLFYQLSDTAEDLTTAADAIAVSQELSPTDPKLFYTGAIIYSELYSAAKDKDEREEYQSRALKEITTAITLKPDYRDGYFLRAKLYRKFNDTHKANQDLRYILEVLDPNDQEAREELDSSL